MSPRLTAALVASCLLFAAAPATTRVLGAETASADDTAKFLAGIKPSAGSPLAPLTKERFWQRYAGAMNKAFARTEKTQVPRIRAWAAEHLTKPQPTLFYMFSGPDFLYANAFFPNASTYVLSALEPVGDIPDLVALQDRRSLNGPLNHLLHSMRNLLSYTFFITKRMKEDLYSGALRGTLPILYVFLARAGKQIRDVQLIELDGDGKVRTDPKGKTRSAANGVKIVFTSGDGRERTLYYFSTDISDDGFKRSGFQEFCRNLGRADSFLKSASYLLHHGGFSQVRDFILERSAAILQDDSGIPLRYFDSKKWALHPFGRYLGPIEVFPNEYQGKLSELFRKAHPGKLDFGVGYRWRTGRSNLLLAVSTDNAAP